MDTVQLMQWHEEFADIMSSGEPEQLQLDKLRDLHKRCTEQEDMWNDQNKMEKAS